VGQSFGVNPKGGKATSLFDIVMTDSDEAVLKTLEQGEITIQGEFLWGSNYTFLVQVEYEGTSMQAVYKPTRGERPLWDFPSATLAKREAAAYILSEALGWRLVPPTVYRNKGPVGPGSLQLYIEHDPEYHYFNFNEKDRQRLRSVALFDVLINNADRKGSHILIDPEDHIWLIDHGICFHGEDKLRTVIWDFAGEKIPEDLCEDVNHLKTQLVNGNSPLTKELRKYLDPQEVKAITDRANKIVSTGSFPNPHTSRRFQPWPPL
jgi:uncharacterized repeat protein (TIGR03843 family)